MYLTVLPDPCLSNPCHNGGRCQQLEISYLCVCTDDWKGSHCTQRMTVTCSITNKSYSIPLPHPIFPEQLSSRTKPLRSRLVHRTPSKNSTVWLTSPVSPQEPQNLPSPGTRMALAFQTSNYPSFSSQSYNSSTVGYTTVKYPIRFALKVTQKPCTQGWLFLTKQWLILKVSCHVPDGD